ncbi:MAG: metallophosphoesterase [Candidatus Micrarchaeota archaeon]
MRILAFSDLHDDEYALLALRGVAGQFDHVFICGDSSSTNAFAEAVLSAFPKAFIIPGNGEGEQANKLILGSPGSIHEKRVEIEDGLNVVGFGYSNHTPFGTYGELTEEEIYRRLSKLPIDGNTLLMLHCPPKGHFDDVGKGFHAGSESVRRVIEERKPLAAFFGHIHEHSGMGHIGPTTLVKIPAANTMKACDVTITNKNTNAAVILL